MVKNASNEVETLTLKYDIIDLELRCGEFRNGTSVENWATGHVGRSCTPLFLLLNNDEESVGGERFALDFLCVAFFGWRPSKRTSQTLHVRVPLELGSARVAPLLYSH